MKLINKKYMRTLALIISAFFAYSTYGATEHKGLARHQSQQYTTKPISSPRIHVSSAISSAQPISQTPPRAISSHKQVRSLPTSTRAQSIQPKQYTHGTAPKQPSSQIHSSSGIRGGGKTTSSVRGGGYYRPYSHYYYNPYYYHNYDPFWHDYWNYGAYPTYWGYPAYWWHNPDYYWDSPSYWEYDDLMYDLDYDADYDIDIENIENIENDDDEYEDYENEDYED